MKRRVFYGLALLVLGICLYRKREEVLGIAAMLMLVIVFSTMLAPLCTKLESRNMSSSRAAAYTVIAFSLVAMIVIAAFIPQLVSRSIYLIKRISPMAASLMHRAVSWVEGMGIVQSHADDAGGMIGVLLSRSTGFLARFSMSFAAQTGRMVFSLILTYYVLCERRKIGNHLLLLFPCAWRKPVLAGMLSCRNAVLSYFSGLMKTSLFISAATAIGLLALGIQDAFLLALFMGIFEMLPYLGPVLAAIPILLSALAQGINTALGALALIVLVQQIESNFVSPYFTAASTSIHPLAAIAGVYVLGNLFGVWGILLAIPIMVLAQSIFWSFRQMRLLMQEQAGVTR